MPPHSCILIKVHRELKSHGWLWEAIYNSFVPIWTMTSEYLVADLIQSNSSIQETPDNKFECHRTASEFFYK